MSGLLGAKTTEHDEFQHLNKWALGRKGNKVSFIALKHRVGKKICIKEEAWLQKEQDMQGKGGVSAGMRRSRGKQADHQRQTAVGLFRLLRGSRRVLCYRSASKADVKWLRQRKE